MLKVAYTLDVRSFHAAELALPGVERGTADRSCSRHTSLAVLPASTDFRIVMIWCSENRDFFMAPSGDGLPEVSSFGLHYFKGGVHRSPY